MTLNAVFARDYEIYCTTYILQNGYEGDDESENQKNIYELSQVKTKEDFFNSIVFRKNKQNFEQKIQKLSNKQKGSSNIKCPKCAQFMIEIAKQKRSSDEGLSYELKCTTCGFTKHLS